MESSMLIACSAVENQIPLIKLPSYIELSNDTCFVHTSLHKATHQVFEEPDPTQVKDYERLEFLGDAVLQFGVSDLLTTLYPGLTEGGCTTLRQSLVKNETLCLLSKALGLPARLQAAPSDLVRLRLNKNVLAAIFEAYLGAIRREHGLTAARIWLDKIYTPLVIVAYEAVSELHRLAEVKKELIEGDLTPPEGPRGIRDPSELLRLRQHFDGLSESSLSPERNVERWRDLDSHKEKQVLQETMSLLSLKRARMESIVSSPPTSITTLSDIVMEDSTQSRIPTYNGEEEGALLVTSFVSFMEEWGRGKGRVVSWRQGAKTGPDHEPSFVYGVTFHDPAFGNKEALGIGRTWKKAKNNAAHAACDVIEIPYQ